VFGSVYDNIMHYSTVYLLVFDTDKTVNILFELLLKKKAEPMTQWPTDLLQSNSKLTVHWTRPSLEPKCLHVVDQNLFYSILKMSKRGPWWRATSQGNWTSNRTTRDSENTTEQRKKLFLASHRVYYYLSSRWVECLKRWRKRPNVSSELPYCLSCCYLSWDGITHTPTTTQLPSSWV